MSVLRKVASKQDIENGSMKTFTLNGTKVTIAHIDGEFFAFNDTCTHAQCSLGEGFLDDHNVICPCHGGTFNIVDGSVVAMPPTTPIATYPLKVEGNDILIQA